MTLPSCCIFKLYHEADIKQYDFPFENLKMLLKSHHYQTRFLVHELTEYSSDNKFQRLTLVLTLTLVRPLNKRATKLDTLVIEIKKLIPFTTRVAFYSLYHKTIYEQSFQLRKD